MKNTQNLPKFLAKLKEPKKPVTCFGINPPDKIENLPREVIKWIQSLDLTYSVKNVKKDFNNGFLVAQILSRYYPVTNDQFKNFNAMQMHQISNGFSMAVRRDNWTQINNFLIKVKEINTRIEDMETFIKNANGEVLLFIISLYQELTKRKIPILEGKIIATDIDNINKSYLLKDNGEIEKLKKSDIDQLVKGLTQKGPIEEEKVNINVEPKETDSAAKEDGLEDLPRSKSNNSFLSKTSNNIVMKGDVKPMATQPTATDKKFTVVISEPKAYEAATRTILQPRESIFRSDLGMRSSSTQDNNKDLDAFANYNSLYQTDKELEQKANSADNPFLKLGEPLSNKIRTDYSNDFLKIKQSKGNKFISDFFKSIGEISDECLNFVMNFILQIIQDFYNILSGRQVNDYVDMFLIIYTSYLSIDKYEDENLRKKFNIMHEGLCTFFLKSLKNKNEEMFFIFKNIFLKKLFCTINDPEYSNKIKDICDLLFRILEPESEQQIDLFKMFRNETKDNEEVMYECFAILHEKINVLNDSLVDGCLFYVLNGLSSDNVNIRYYSLKMLLKYCMTNVNFVTNFAQKIEKLAKFETDRENCILLINIVLQTFKSAYIRKTTPKEINKKGGDKDKLQEKLDKIEKLNGDIPIPMEIDQNTYLNEISFGNKIIKIIVNKFEGDNLFVLLFANSVNDYLFDNEELYKILVTCLFQANDSIMELELYGGSLDENMKNKSEFTFFRNPNFKVSIMDGINHAMFLKAFDSMVQEQGITELNSKDYRFIMFIVQDGLDKKYSDIYKTSFNFYDLVIQDIDKLDKVSKCLTILNSFLECGPIQKTLFDTWYDSLNKMFQKIISDEDPEVKKCQEEIQETIKRWINSDKIGQIVRDDIKKLAEVFPKSTIEVANSS